MEQAWAEELKLKLKELENENERSGKITRFQHNGAISGTHSHVMRLTEDESFVVLINTLPLDPIYD
jgi:hypothetical protein